MKLKLPPDTTSVSVAGKEFRAEEDGGLIDVGNLPDVDVQKLLAHAKCTLAGPDDEVVEATHAVERNRRVELLKALSDLGIKADGRLGPAKLEEMLAAAKATVAQVQPATPTGTVSA